jgi:hypothetical protein
MNLRAVSGVAVGTLLLALSAVPHSLHTDDCSPYAAQLGINPGPSTPDSPHGITACDDFSVTAIGDGPSALITLVLCIAGSVLLIRHGSYRSVVGVMGTGVAAAGLGSLVCFIYSGLEVSELVSDSGVRFSLVVVAVTTAIMASLELRRLANKSLERTRDG